MKRFVFIAAAAAMVFASCEKKEHTPALSGNDVSFLVDEVITRVTTTGTTSTFEAGDQITITGSGVAGETASAKYSYTGSSLTLADGETALKYNDMVEASFVAHYPAELTNNSGAISMTVASDQSTDDNFHKQMFMVASATGKAGQGAVKLKFAHQMAWVKIKVVNHDMYTATGVTFNNIKPTATWTSSGIGDATGTELNIKPWKQGEENEWWALIPAQTIPAGTELFTITTPSKAFAYTTVSDVEFTTAKVKTVTLTLKPNNVDGEFSGDINPDNWGEDSELEGSAGEQRVVLISSNDGNFSNVSLNPTVTGSSSVTNIGWTPLINGTDRGTITYDGVTNSMNIYSSTSPNNNAWHNLALVYRTNKVVSSGQQFKLTFEYKASALSWEKPAGETTTNTATQLNIRFLQPEVTPTNANIAWANNQGPKPTSTEEYTKVELNVKILDTPTISGTPTTESTLNNGLLVVFGANASDGVTYSIRNVKFEEAI